MRIFHAHASGFDAADAPRRGAEQEDVAGQALDREILVERADDRPFRLGDDQVIRVLRNRAARRDGGKPRAAPAAHDAVHLIAMQERAAAAALRGDALREHLDDGVEIARAEDRDRDRRCGRARTDRLRSRLRSCGGDDLLRQDVERPWRNLQRVQRAGADRTNQRGAFDQFVARGGEDASLRNAVRIHPVAGAADALQRHGDRSRRADLADQIDRSDIDAQFERCRRDHRAQLAVLQPLLGLETQSARQASMMRQHCVSPSRSAR